VGRLRSEAGEKGGAKKIPCIEKRGEKKKKGGHSAANRTVLYTYRGSVGCGGGKTGKRERKKSS